MNMSKTHRSAASVDQLENLMAHVEQGAKDDFIDATVTYVTDELPAGETATDEQINEALDMAREWMMTEALGNLTESASGAHSAMRIVDGIRARYFAKLINETSNTGFHKNSWVRVIRHKLEDLKKVA